jgi:hypothetical protein
MKKQTGKEEYTLKAAFLYRFTDYVDWENNAADNFSIAIVGESEITSPLIDLAGDKKIKNKRIRVNAFNNINDLTASTNGIGAYQIIFVSHNYTGIENVISKVADLPILVITEERGAAEKGAVINFLIVSNKLKFEVNMKAVYRSGLKISSQLLQHAILVNP